MCNTKCCLLCWAENVADAKETLAEEQQPSTPPREDEEAPRPQPGEPEPNLEDSRWEVLATSAEVEYLHTGNLVDVLSSNPWEAAAGEEENFDSAGNTKGGGSGDTNPLLTPPPEDLSVSLHLENDPANTLVVVAVPRWLSDGEVWEVSLPPALMHSSKCQKYHPFDPSFFLIPVRGMKPEEWFFKRDPSPGVH